MKRAGVPDGTPALDSPPMCTQKGRSSVPVAWSGSSAPCGTIGSVAREPALPSFAGQITPSHDLSRHLKSGALGFRLVARLSHIRPPHFGQLSASTVIDGGAEETLSRGSSASSRSARAALPYRRLYAACGSSSGFA